MSTKKQEANELFRDGNKLYKGQLYEKALDHYQRATELSETFYNAHFCVAKTHIRLQRYERGIKHFQKHIHLIPEDERATYAIGLAGILLEEGQTEKAFELVKEKGNEVSGKQLPTYLNILLANGNINRVILVLINLPRQRADELYQQMVNEPSLKTSHQKMLQQEYAVPEYHKASDKAALLARAPAESSDYSEKAKSLQRYAEQGKKDFGNSFRRYLDTLKEKITEVQVLLADLAKSNIDRKNTSRAQTQLEILEKTGYDTAKTQNLHSSLSDVKKQRRNTYLKYAGAAALVLLLLFGAVQGYSYFSHSWAWSNAKEADTYSSYRSYLVSYPEGPHTTEAEKRAETRLWEGIKRDSTQARFEEYLQTYPNGRYSSEAREILNTQFGGRPLNLSASDNQRPSRQSASSRNARVTGSDVIIRSDHTTESEVAGLVEEEGEEVEIMDEYYPQNSGEGILSRSITVSENGEAIELSEGKAVSILSGGSNQVRVSFAYKDHGRITTTINRDDLEGIGGQKWYKVRTADNTTGWIYGQFIQEL